MQLSVILPVLLAALYHGADGYKTFQSYLPNGANVPHPCVAGVTWVGVGHERPEGAGPRNVFGLAFKDAGYDWATVCPMDSDGDGRTNGQELGDPTCAWSRGQPDPAAPDDVTHPGVCEPVNAPNCQAANSFLQCEEKKDVIDNCRTINMPETEMIDLRFPPTPIPNIETSYYCMTFDLPSDQDYHIKAFQALIGNGEIIHHILMFGCEPTENPKPVDTKPGECKMSSEECSTILGLWAVGVDGRCYEEDIGFRIGKNAYSRVKLEFHWNNPLLLQGQTDNSGMRIYYQPAKENVQDMASLFIGQRLLTIPPRQPRVEVEAVCNGFCTNALVSQPFYIVNAINHMHFLGREQSVEIFRDGKLVKQLTNDKNYRYDAPTDALQTPHFELLPGDEIKTTCVFSSAERDRWTYYGDGTSDEMCFAFLLGYPIQAFPFGPSCVSYGPLDPCTLYEGTKIGSCDWKTFVNLTHPETLPTAEKVEKDCNVDGFCRPECQEISDKLVGHPCMNGEAGQVVKYILSESEEGLEHMTRINSCQRGGTCKNCKPCSEEEYIADTGPSSLPSVALLLISAIICAWL